MIDCFFKKEYYVFNELRDERYFCDDVLKHTHKNEETKTSLNKFNKLLF